MWCCIILKWRFKGLLLVNIDLVVVFEDVFVLGAQYDNWLWSWGEHASFIISKCEPSYTIWYKVKKQQVRNFVVAEMHILVHGNNHHVLPLTTNKLCIVKLKQYEELNFEIEEFILNIEQVIILISMSSHSGSIYIWFYFVIIIYNYYNIDWLFTIKNVSPYKTMHKQWRQQGVR